MKRIAKLQDLLRRDGLHSAVFAPSSAMQYLLGDISMPWQRTSDTGGLDLSKNGHYLNRTGCILLIPAEGEPMLFVAPTLERDFAHIPFKTEVDYYAMLPDRLKGRLQGKVGVGQCCEGYLSSIVKGAGAEPVSAEGYTDSMRCIKDEDEIAKLRSAAELTDRAMMHIAENMRPGHSSRQVVYMLSEFGRKNGSTDLSFTPAAIFVAKDAPGSESIYGHGFDEPMRENTCVGFDFGFTLNGYCSDYGRSLYCGRDDVMRDDYKALQNAQLKMISLIKPGTPMNICESTIENELAKTGRGHLLRKYGDNKGTMGHQIGLDCHERPWLWNGSRDTFQKGMVFCLEPKIWRPGRGYIRVEDMILVTENGCEILTVFPRDIFYVGD